MLTTITRTPPVINTLPYDARIPNNTDMPLILYRGAV